MDVEPSPSTPKVRKKLLKPRSQKYYSRKAKIEQALLSLETDKIEQNAFVNIPSSAILSPSCIVTANEATDNNLPDDQEILCIPTDQSAWCTSSTKIEKFNLPTYITQMPEQEMQKVIPRAFSIETWNSLPLDVQTQLSNYLPNFEGSYDDQQKEIQNTLEKLFSDANFYFGNPIQQFLSQLADKRFQPQRRSVIQNQKLIGQFSHIQYLKERNQDFIRKVIELKNELELEESHNHLLMAPTSKQYSSSHLVHGYQEDSDTDADSGGEDSLSISSQKDLKEKLVAAVSRKEDPITDEDLANVTLGKRSRGSGRAAQNNRSLRNLLFDGTEQSDVTPPGPVWIFFTTIRDLFLLNNFEMTLAQMEEEFNKDEEKLSCLVPTCTLHQFLLFGLNFLKDPPLVNLSEGEKKKKAREVRKAAAADSLAPPSILHDHASKCNEDRAKAAAEYQPGGPFVSVDENEEIWRWVGAIDEDTIREELDTLELLFYFAVTRKQFSECGTMINLVTVKQQKCTSTIRNSTTEEVEEFRKQEQERYLAPERPYCYKFRDYESIIAPMKRGLGNQSQKAREHFLLKNERPPHISLLCLVRDAAARLPGGIGTRPDVAILLCDSQFVVPDVSESKLNTVVSGALDRLHAQIDPCVKFDSDQKLWIYLHRRRKEENFPVYKPQKKKGRR